MRQCQRCFVLNKQDAVECVRCGALLLPPWQAPPRLRVATPVPPTVSRESPRPVAVPLASRGTVSKSLMYAIGLLLLLPVLLLVSQDWDGANAGPGAAVSEPHIPPRDVRRQQITAAAALLRQQLDSLEALLRNGPPGGEPMEAAMRGWQGEMERIKATYRIWGVVDIQHPDPTAEDALRNAYLYLYSLKHLGATDPHWETGAEYRRVREAFLASLDRAVR